MARKRVAESPPYTASVFRWARVRAGYDAETAAKKLSVPVSNLLDWEDDKGGLVPTVNQARQMATLYGRSFLEWFLPAPPDLPEPKLIPDFRVYRDAADPSDTRELLDAQLWAESHRDSAIDLYSDLKEEIPTGCERIFAGIDDDVENVATSVREIMEFPIEQQAGFNSQQRLAIPGLIRDKIEALGILTLRRSDLKRYGVRGFCIAEFPLPVIVFTSESPNAQTFTLGHELGHVLLRQSALSGPWTRRGGEFGARVIEAWCNSFSAAFLMPRATVLAREPIPNSPRESLSDNFIKDFADYFGVSEQAMLIRLVNLDYVEADYYWNVKRPAYEQIERDFKQFGRPKFYGRRYSSSLGNLYTSLVLEALQAGRITNHNAAEFMGIKNFSHLHDIRENYGT